MNFICYFKIFKKVIDGLTFFFILFLSLKYNLKKLLAKSLSAVENLMKVTKSKKLDTVYEEVKGYDLVLTADISLADALNSRLEKPVLGNFAITPKNLVYSKDPTLLDKRDLFEKIMEETDLSWKQAKYLLDNVIDCWKNTGNLEAIYDYDRFDGENISIIVDILKDTKNFYSAMSEMNLSDEKSVAVVDYYKFNELEKKVLPESYDKVHRFIDDKYELPEFKVFSSGTGIVQSILENIDQESAKDVAIVMEPDSSYESLIRSKLSVEGINYMGQFKFSDDIAFRTYIKCLRKSLNTNRLLVREIRPLFSFFDVNISVKYNEEYISDLELSELDDFMNFLSRLESSTFSEALNLFEERSSVDMSNVENVLGELDILDAEVTENNVDFIEYYMNTFDITVEDNEKGVLLATPKGITTVDRPIVFYVGMDSEWDVEVPRKPWVDEEEFKRNQLKNFQLLLQNGNEQYFLVQDKFMGEPVSPCIYFNELTDQEFDTFSDFKHNRFEGVEIKDAAGFSKETNYADIEEVKTISQSSLNKFVRCPREYFFDQLITSIDKDFFKKGNLYHDFAEFCVNYPDFVKEKGITEFVDLMVTEIKPHVDDIRLDYLRTEFSIGARNILQYIEEEDIETNEFEGYEKGEREENIFARYFDREIYAENTEVYFCDHELGCKGKVDLIKDETHIVDFKSGNYKTPYRIVNKSNVDLYEDYPDFQAIMYLTYHRKKHPDRKLKFTFYHFLNNIGDVVSGEGDIEDNKSTIVYYPRYFNEFVRTLETFNKLKSGVSESNSRRKTLEKLGYSCYSRFFDGREIPHQYDRDKLLESQLATDFIKYCKDKIGDYKYVEKGCRSVLKKLSYFRISNYFEEDMEAFEKFVDQKLKEMNEFKETRFPIGDIDLEKVENRDLMIV